MRESQEWLDKTTKRPIVVEENMPSEGAGNTDRGLTGQAENGSVAAERNPTNALSSRQSLPEASDGFFVRQVDYCPPPDEVVNDFVRMVCLHLSEGETNGLHLMTTRQGFRQFLRVVVGIVAKEANRREPS
jgi:hypothetical protein